jgi:spermidine/putrescine transport system permease protein
MLASVFVTADLADLLSRIRHRDSLKVLILIVPTLVFLAIFFAFPFLITGRYSIGVVDQFNNLIQGALTVNNYVAVFQGAYFAILLRSLWIAFATTALCILLGYPVAYWIGVKSGKMKNLAMLLVIIPFWSSFLIRTYAMMSLLYRGGVINESLLQLNLIPEPLDLLYNPFSVMLGMVYNYLPYMILPLYASTEKLDLSLLEAGQSLGANHAKVFLRITLPLTLPGIMAGSILVFVPAFGEFVVPQLLGGTSSVMVGQLIWNQFQSYTGSWTFGSAVSVVVVVLILAIVTLFIRYVTEGEAFAF